MLTSDINRVNSKKILIDSRMPKENKSSIVVLKLIGLLLTGIMVEYSECLESLDLHLEARHRCFC